MGKIALTPPMGWNSWDCYGASVTEDEVRGNAEYMAAYLKRYRWEYIVVDIQWYEPDAVSSRYRNFVPLCTDQYSRLVPAENRFPSSKNGAGFKPLADYVHNLGLKFGIHILRGIPRQAVHAAMPILGTNKTARDIAHQNSICPWNTDMYGVNPKASGAQEYYDSLFKLYAEWGVDFVKVDDISASVMHPDNYHLHEIEMIRKAIDNCGRDILLSLSPGPAPIEKAEHLQANANMWRMTNDFWDRWSDLLYEFDRCEKWYPFNGAGHWADCDMLPLGRIGIRSVEHGLSDRMCLLTKDEQVLMVTLWVIFRSPLMFGGDLRFNDEWTNSLITNEEVLEVLKNSHSNRPVFNKENKVAWTAQGEGCVYAALFNLAGETQNVRLGLSEIGIDFDVYERNLWSKSDTGRKCGFIEYTLNPHASVLLKLTDVN